MTDVWTSAGVIVGVLLDVPKTTGRPAGCAPSPRERRLDVGYVVAGAVLARRG